MKSVTSRKVLADKEKRLINCAKEAWGKTLKEFYFPPLETPNFVFDYSHKEGFYIDPDNQWKITMNLADAPLFKEEDDYVNFFHAISMHEVSHYEIIPYDGLIHAKLLKAAMKYVNHNFAPIVVNIFADLVIDTMMYKKHPNLMKWESQKTYEHISAKYGENLSDFSKFLFRAYEKLWNHSLLDDSLLSKRDLIKALESKKNTEEKKSEMIKLEQINEKDMQKIENYNSLSKMDNLANKVAKEVLKDFEDETTWEKKVTNVSKILKNLVNDSFALIGRGTPADKGKSKRKVPGKAGGEIEIPEDILEIMDNPLENKNRDKLKQDNEDDLRRKAEEFARDTPYSEFGSPANQAGIMVDGSPLATWYRGLAKNLIEIKIYEEKPGGQVPIYPDVWRIGDPIEELDVVQTLLNSPVIIPNITTRKWVNKEGPGHLEEKQIPDLLIVLDSSGSMGWNYTAKSERGRGPYHTALVASFAALHYAAQKGVKFSVINFSGREIICPWTLDYNKAEKVLLKYQVSGTILPTKTIAAQCDKADRNVLIFVITDFGIYNWGQAKKIMMNLANRGHKMVGFFIGASSIPSARFKGLLDKVTFYPVRNTKDLINLVIQEVKRYYS